MRDANAWDTALNWPNTPVRATVVGRDVTLTPHLYYQNVYNFFNFKTLLQPEDAFQTTDLIPCLGRTPKKSLPAMAPAASFTVEIVDVRGQITSYKESYDTKLLLAKYTDFPIQGLYGPEVGDSITEVHDFHTGIAYILNPETGYCTCQRIQERDDDDFHMDNNYIRMDTAAQIFSTDVRNYSYEGQVMTRGILTDRYVAYMVDYPRGHPRQNSTYDMRFATSGYSRVQQTQDTFSGGVPVQSHLVSPSSSESFTFNFYNFIQAKPNLLEWDISSCYKKKRVLQFAVSGCYRSQISSNIETFKHHIHSALSSSLQISPLRICRINIKLNVANEVRVTFTLLGTAPMRGNVEPYRQTSLESVVANLAKIVKKYAFVIKAVFASQDEVLHAIPTSFRDITKEGETTSTSAKTSQTQGTSPKLPDTLSAAPRTSSAAPGTSPASSSTTSPTTSAKSSDATNQGAAETTGATKSGAAETTQTKPWRKTTTTTEGYVTHVPRPSKPHVTTQGLPGPLSGLCRNNQVGYKIDTVVGVCFAMLAVGGVLGTGTAFFMSKRRNFRFF